MLFRSFCIACSAPPAKDGAGNGNAEAQALASRSSDMAKKYEGQLIRLAVTGEESARVYIVRGGAKHWVKTPEWIKSQGFKWPDDVKAISREDMSLIPDGPPVPE